MGSCSQVSSVSKELSVFTALGLVEVETEVQAVPWGLSPVATACHLPSQTLPAQRTPVAPSEAAEDLSGWPGRSYHLLSSQTSFLASFYTRVIVSALFLSFAEFFFLSSLFTQSPADTNQYLQKAADHPTPSSLLQGQENQAPPCPGCSEGLLCPPVSSHSL